jgi:hypothetical protein
VTAAAGSGMGKSATKRWTAALSPSMVIVPERCASASDLKHFARVNDRFGSSRYATTVLGVTQLPAPQLLVLLEATAVD